MSESTFTELAAELIEGQLRQKDETIASLRAALEAREGENDRLFDLVRYCRGTLHEEGLITDEEYARIVDEGANYNRGSVERLQTYDQLRAENAELRERVEADAWVEFDNDNPPKGYCLIYTDDGCLAVARYWDDDYNSNDFWQDANRMGYYYQNVTHYKPLGEQPGPYRPNNEESDERAT